jgi:hypothetical protein
MTSFSKAIAILAIALTSNTLAAGQKCPNGKCPQKQHWTFPANTTIETHLQAAPHFTPQATIASMSQEQMLTLHDQLHEQPKSPKFAGRNDVRYAHVIPGELPTVSNEYIRPEFFPLGLDVQPMIDTSASTLRNQSSVALRLTPTMVDRETPRVRSVTRSTISGGGQGRIHATALAVSSGRPCPRPSVLKSKSKLRPTPILNALSFIGRR